MENILDLLKSDFDFNITIKKSDLIDFANFIMETQKSILEKQKPDIEPLPEFITRKETAQILGISLPTLNEWTKNGTIPAQRIGTRIRYKKTDVYNSLKDVETLKYRRI